MKKLLSVVLVTLMILSLVACGGSKDDENVSVKNDAAKGEKLSMTIEKKGSQTGEMYAADVYYEPSETITVESDYKNKQNIKNTENGDMDTDASALYESEYVQNIVKTLTYNGIVTPEAETAE